jgi:hypothetical protein
MSEIDDLERTLNYKDQPPKRKRGRRTLEFCSRGHAMTEDNIIWGTERGKGKNRRRTCRQCRAISRRKWKKDNPTWRIMNEYRRMVKRYIQAWNDLIK